MSFSITATGTAVCQFYVTGLTLKPLRREGRAAVGFRPVATYVTGMLGNRTVETTVLLYCRARDADIC